jgi:hypothetical protein
MGIHPDKTAIRAVEACGGTYTKAEYLSGFAAAHDAAIGEAARAVAPCDALTAELLEALQSLVANLAEGDFISETRIDAARAAIRKATGEAA